MIELIFIIPAIISLLGTLIYFYVYMKKTNTEKLNNLIKIHDGDIERVARCFTPYNILTVDYGGVPLACTLALVLGGLWPLTLIFLGLFSIGALYDKYLSDSVEKILENKRKKKTTKQALQIIRKQNNPANEASISLAPRMTGVDDNSLSLAQIGG